ncbi:MAG TPA: hypothetical protein VH063_03895 [Gaiellaceae bacterium]|jgi:succinate dehydrogenase / fumarate reductase membrane anchor subunit|nr:hypothetical protein [Gaiellaceae bacterium]
MSGPAAAWERPAITAPALTGESERTPYLVEYLLLRLTGVLLSVLVLGHFVVTHFVTDVAKDDSAFVSRQLSSFVWVFWDSLMLAAALAHGATGVRVALADYAISGRRRRAISRALVTACTALFVIGLVAIWRLAHA